MSQLILNLVRTVTGSPFIASVTVLATGTVIAQVIRLFASPILTRLYTPEAFGLFAAFMAFIVSLMPGITGKYETALVLPKHDNKAVHIFGVAVWFSMAVFILFLCFLLVFQNLLLDSFNAPELEGWIFLAPIVLLFGGLFNLGQFIAIRGDNYRLMARSKIVMAISTVLINILLGLMDVGFQGLLIGNLAGFIIAGVYLYFENFHKLAKACFSGIKKKIVLARAYSDFPIYNASSGILDGITVSLPVFFLSYYYPIEIVGYYALVMNVLIVPKRFLASAVSQVNLKKVAGFVNAGKPVEPYLYRLSASILLLSLPPSILLMVWGPELFHFVFGEMWREAGKFAQILAIALAVKLVSSTLSSSLGATNNNRLGALWKTLAFISTFTVLFLLSGREDVYTLLLALTINDLVLYVFYYFLILRAVKKPKKLLGVGA
ncbi:lipopolysaccharide biosynthesis protein [Kaarinaea lacus]